MNNIPNHARQYTFYDKCIAWIQLTRFDKPVGTELLLYPTLWAVLLAWFGVYGEFTPLSLLLIFALGAVLMRAAGCAINDFADRKVDGAVERTKHRPLADGRLSARTAVITFVGLSLLAGCLLFLLPVAVFYWSLAAVGLAFVYPFMKRYTHLPQVVLACAFGWAIPMAFVAVFAKTGMGDMPDMWGWLLFIAYMCWTVAYDTAYAMCDRNDDIKIGVKSTAILFGRYDVIIIVLLQIIFSLIMLLVFYHYFGGLWFVGLLPIFWLFYRQYQLIKTRERLSCFKAFLDNVWIGRYIFIWTVACIGIAVWR
ncbi:MAG: 4-hydroxybenzoate octaprenyltransferase [Moraxella sp.]|nr:4-hydroxybenzoate octaprenyltransferase [Moraxella sp.]